LAGHHRRNWLAEYQSNLIDWTQPVIQVEGAASGRVWYQLDGPPTNQAFFKLEAELK